MIHPDYVQYAKYIDNYQKGLTWKTTDIGMTGTSAIQARASCRNNGHPALCPPDQCALEPQLGKKD